MENGFKEVNNRFDRIETLLDAVVDQTKDLTEFRTETQNNFDDLILHL
jgi:hypothetical protein